MRICDAWKYMFMLCSIVHLDCVLTDLCLPVCSPAYVHLCLPMSTSQFSPVCVNLSLHTCLCSPACVCMCSPVCAYLSVVACVFTYVYPCAPVCTCVHLHVLTCMSHLSVFLSLFTHLRSAVCVPVYDHLCVLCSAAHSPCWGAEVVATSTRSTA